MFSPSAPRRGFNYRRLEITVLGARPMNEVGFRQLQAEKPSTTKPALSVQVSVGSVYLDERTNLTEIYFLFKFSRCSNNPFNRDLQLVCSSYRLGGFIYHMHVFYIYTIKYIYRNDVSTLHNIITLLYSISMLLYST